MHPSRTWILAAALLTAGCGKKAADMSRGGVELAFEAALPAGTGEGHGAELVEKARKIALARLSGAGVQAVVKTEGLLLKIGLPGKPSAETVAEAKALMAMVGRLELSELDDGMALRELQGKLPEEEASVDRDTWQDANGGPKGAYYLVAQSEAQGRKHAAAATLPGGATLVIDPGQKSVRLFVAKATSISNDDIKNATAPTDTYLPPEVALTFTQSGTAKFAELTKRIFGRKLVAVVDGRIEDAVVVMQTASEGKYAVTVSSPSDKAGKQQLARRIAAAVRSGPLPVPFTFKEERQVGGR